MQNYLIKSGTTPAALRLLHTLEGQAIACAIKSFHTGQAVDATHLIVSTKTVRQMLTNFAEENVSQTIVVPIYNMVFTVSPAVSGDQYYYLIDGISLS